MTKYVYKLCARQARVIHGDMSLTKALSRGARNVQGLSDELRLLPLVHLSETSGRGSRGLAADVGDAAVGDGATLGPDGEEGEGQLG